MSDVVDSAGSASHSDETFAQRVSGMTIHENEHRFRVALANSPVVLCEQDLDLRYTWVYKAKLGYSANEFIGKTDAELMDPVCVPALEAIKRGVIASGQPIRQEVAVAAPGAPLEYYDLYVEPRLDAEGRIVGVICAGTDISARKRIDRELERYRDNLETLVLERTAKLGSAEAEHHRLNRALRLLSLCNSSVVHATNEAQLFNDLCHLSVQSGGYLMAWIGVPEQDAAKTVKPVAQSGDADHYLENVRISWDGEQSIGLGPTGTAIRTGITQVNHNCETNPKMLPWREAALKRGYQSSVALPLAYDNKVFATLMLYSSESVSFGRREVELLEELASNVAYGIQSLRARAELDRYRQTLEEKVAERTAAIEKMAQNTRLFIKQAPIAIAMFDSDMNYLEASGRWLDDYGLNQVDWCGRNHYDVHPDLPEAYKQVHQRAMAGETVRSDENLWVHVDGARQWLRWVVLPWTDTDGNIGGIIISAEDITPRKLAEEQLRFAVADAERANKAKSRFLAAASHDLRQPLAAVNIYAGSLKGHVTEKGQTLLANMTNCIESLGELLGDLLDLSKLEAGVVVPTIRDFSLTEVLEPLMAAHEPSSLLKGLHVRYRPTAMVVRSDPVLLRRIIGNFLSNAVRYTERGGFLVACRQHSGKTWLEVWDTGIGIAANHTTEIFEEFKQLDDGARTRGSGLGLAIVARTASLLGLAIRVSSRPERGSLFAIELPPGLPLTETPTVATHTAAYRSLRIALVDDNEAVREALTLSLQDAGHQVTSAATGADLREQLRNATVDILVADYRLPQGETGLNVIAAMRAKTPELPAILLTGDTAPRLVREMAEHGVTVLHKPMDLETLLAYLEDLTCPARV